MLKKCLSGFILVLAFAGIFCETGYAQDPQFTQFYANPLFLNPALAGAARCPRLIMNYRNQWPGISGNYLTYSASYDQHVDQLQGGIGLMAYNDAAGEGTIETTSFSGIYSYQLPVTRTFSIKAGFEASYFQKSIDWSKLTFGDMIDARYGFIYQTQEVPGANTVRNVDFSAGALGFSKIFYFGFSVHHLTEPNESFFTSEESRLPRRYTAHGGAVIPFNRRYPKDGSISPNILFQSQGTFTQLNFGLYVTKGPIVGGVWYRSNDAFIVLAGVQTDRFRFGYSYDVTTSSLTLSQSGGSHELSVALQFECKQRKRKFRALSCPKF